MYKNKLVAEVNKEVEKENEGKLLEEKKVKIRKMLAIIESKESIIEKKLEEVEIEKKQIVVLKDKLEKEDFSFLKDGWLDHPYGTIIGIDTDRGSSAMVYNHIFKY
jgi:hypothetical protein